MTTTDKNPTALMIDYKTGEIKDNMYPGDQITIQREEQLKYAREHIINFNKGKSFVKIYDESIGLLERYLTPPEFKFALCLATHVSYADCIIRRTRDPRSMILSMKDIAEIHGYKYDYVRKIMSQLKKKGVIGRHETGTILTKNAQNIDIVYTVNPYIYFIIKK